MILFSKKADNPWGKMSTIVDIRILMSFCGATRVGQIVWEHSFTSTYSFQDSSNIFFPHILVEIFQIIRIFKKSIRYCLSSSKLSSVHNKTVMIAGLGRVNYYNRIWTDITVVIFCVTRAELILGVLQVKISVLRQKLVII